MNLPNHLLREAGRLASSQTVRRVELSADIGRLEGRRALTEAEKVRLEDLRAELEICSQALSRFANYRPWKDAEPNCPHCWIVFGEHFQLRVGAEPDTYECGTCRTQYP